MNLNFAEKKRKFGKSSPTKVWSNLNKRHIDKYTLLYFAQKLLHEKKIKHSKECLYVNDQSIQHWASLLIFPVIDHLPYA